MCACGERFYGAGICFHAWIFEKSWACINKWQGFHGYSLTPACISLLSPLWPGTVGESFSTIPVLSLLHHSCQRRGSRYRSPSPSPLDSGSPLGFARNDGRSSRSRFTCVIPVSDVGHVAGIRPEEQGKSIDGMGKEENIPWNGQCGEYLTWIKKWRAR